MPVPKRKTSKARRDQRCAGINKFDYSSTNCVTCGAGISQHSVCTVCGFYKGEKIIRTKEDRQKDRDLRKEAKSKGSEQEAEDLKQAQELAKEAKAEKAVAKKIASGKDTKD